jgi:hypothetical protein
MPAEAAMPRPAPERRLLERALALALELLYFGRAVEGLDHCAERGVAQRLLSLRLRPGGLHGLIAAGAERTERHQHRQSRYPSRHRGLLWAAERYAAKASQASGGEK